MTVHRNWTELCKHKTLRQNTCTPTRVLVWVTADCSLGRAAKRISTASARRWIEYAETTDQTPDETKTENGKCNLMPKLVIHKSNPQWIIGFCDELSHKTSFNFVYMNCRGTDNVCDSVDENERIRFFKCGNSFLFSGYKVLIINYLQPLRKWYHTSS